MLPRPNSTLIATQSRIDLRPAPSASDSQAGGSTDAPQPSESRSRHHRHLHPDGGDAGSTTTTTTNNDPPEGGRSARMSRFLELHLGLSPTAEPEERIAALLRFRDEGRRRSHGHDRRSHRTHSNSRRRTQQRSPGRRRSTGPGTAASGSGSGSRPTSGLSSLIRDSFRRRSGLTGLSGSGSGSTATAAGGLEGGERRSQTRPSSLVVPQQQQQQQQSRPTSVIGTQSIPESGSGLAAGVVEAPSTTEPEVVEASSSQPRQQPADNTVIGEEVGRRDAGTNDVREGGEVEERRRDAGTNVTEEEGGRIPGGGEREQQKPTIAVHEPADDPSYGTGDHQN